MSTDRCTFAGKFAGKENILSITVELGVRKYDRNPQCKAVFSILRLTAMSGKVSTLERIKMRSLASVF
jgi:hypothetical protein